MCAHFQFLWMMTLLQIRFRLIGYDSSRSNERRETEREREREEESGTKRGLVGPQNVWQIEAGPKVDLKRDDNDATLCNVIIFSSRVMAESRMRGGQRRAYPNENCHKAVPALSAWTLRIVLELTSQPAGHGPGQRFMAKPKPSKQVETSKRVQRRLNTLTADTFSDCQSYIICIIQGRLYSICR